MKLLNHKIFLYISAVSSVLSIIALITFGLNLGVDFKGGTSTELAFKQAPGLNDVQSAIKEAGIENAQVVTTGDNGIIFKTPVIEQEQHQKVLESIKAKVGEFEEVRFDSIGPVVGDDLKKNAVYQLILVSLGIIFYISYAFRKVTRPITSWQFGITAIVALVHDLLIVLGVFAVLGKFYGVEIDSLFVTAILTVLGFSVHDTIIVFDRIRENLKVYAGQSLDFIINHSISQTITRSLNTSLTVLFVLLPLLLFGGESIKYFVLALFIGVVAGTYSSIFIASPLLSYWQKYRMRK